MNTKFVLLSNLLLVLWACIMPVKAQHSFAFSYGGSNDERIQGMRELSNHTYIVYGASFGVGGSNYVACFDTDGNSLWERKAISPLGYMYHSALDVNQKIFLGGEYDLQLEHNAGVSMLSYDGEILFDSVYKVAPGGGGSILDLIFDKEEERFVSLGIGAPRMGESGVMLQQTLLNGKRIMYQYCALPMFFSYKSGFRLLDKNEYLVFGTHHYIRLDSTGATLSPLTLAVDSFSQQYITDVIQTDSGGFVAIVYEDYQKSWLQYYDKQGVKTGGKIRIPIPYFDGGAYTVLNTTKEGGLVLLGKDMLVLDNHLKEKTRVRFWKGDYYEWRSVAQAADGGFYGCAWDNHKNDASDYDIFVFKTLPDGSVRTGITELPGKQDMQVYPNPASQYLHLPEAAYGAEVRVIDVTGKEVLQQSAITSMQLDVSSLAPGYYTLQLTTPTHQYAQKICIVK